MLESRCSALCQEAPSWSKPFWLSAGCKCTADLQIYKKHKMVRHWAKTHFMSNIQATYSPLQQIQVMHLPVFKIFLGKSFQGGNLFIVLIRKLTVVQVTLTAVGVSTSTRVEIKPKFCNCALIEAALATLLTSSVQNEAINVPAFPKIQLHLWTGILALQKWFWRLSL